jgi:hypothetical protein
MKENSVKILRALIWRKQSNNQFWFCKIRLMQKISFWIMNSKIGMKIFVLITTSKEFLKFCLICVQMQINSLENGTVNNTHSKESEFLIKAEKI